MKYPVFVLLAILTSLAVSAQEQSGLAPEAAAVYRLGPDDQFVLHGVDIDEIAEKPLQVGQDGTVSLPLIGTVHAGGMTVLEFEAALNAKLSAIIRKPQVSITVTDLRSQPVSVLGAVNNAGVHQLRGTKMLTEVLALAGGVRTDAGYRINIVRQKEWGPIPLPNAHPDESGSFSVAEVNLKAILAATSPKENIRIFPHDVITVPRAELVYVVGQVVRSGGFVLNDNESITVLQALALAGGLSPNAGVRNARVLRPKPGSSERIEIAVNLNQVLAGKLPDTQMKADDILFIPNNLPKAATLRALEASIQIGTGLVIWR
jgi:polysaccharide export outer membrane protein